MAMTGKEFVDAYASKGYASWEAAALELAQKDGLTPWPWVDLDLADGAGNTARLRVQTDVLAIGPTQDSVRLPLTPGGAQNILNLYGWLLPTSWLVFKMFEAATEKLTPIQFWPNLGADLKQYAAHSAKIDAQRANAAVQPGAGPHLLSGIKKHVVVSNIYKPPTKTTPGTVVIFGWYWPPPAPVVYDDKKPWTDPSRQPIQVKSNAHGDFYVDYSHGIQAIGPQALVNGQVMDTVDLYQHPTLSALVSNEGPVRVPRYPAVVLPRKNYGGPGLPYALNVITNQPSLSNQALKPGA